MDDTVVVRVASLRRAMLGPSTSSGAVAASSYSARTRNEVTSMLLNITIKEEEEEEEEEDLESLSRARVTQQAPKPPSIHLSVTEDCPASTAAARADRGAKFSGRALSSVAAAASKLLGRLLLCKDSSQKRRLALAQDARAQGAKPVDVTLTAWNSASTAVAASEQCMAAGNIPRARQAAEPCVGIGASNPAKPYCALQGRPLAQPRHLQLLQQQQASQQEQLQQPRHRHHRHHHRHHSLPPQSQQHPKAPPPRTAHLVQLMDGDDVRLAMQALQLAAQIHDHVWGPAASVPPNDPRGREALLEAATPLYDMAMGAARAIQHRALHSLVKQAVRRYVDASRGSPDDVLRVILELLTGCGGAVSTTSVGRSASHCLSDVSSSGSGSGRSLWHGSSSTAPTTAPAMSSGKVARRTADLDTFVDRSGDSTASSELSSGNGGMDSSNSSSWKGLVSTTGADGCSHSTLNGGSGKHRLRFHSK